MKKIRVKAIPRDEFITQGDYEISNDLHLDPDSDNFIPSDGITLQNTYAVTKLSNQIRALLEALTGAIPSGRIEIEIRKENVDMKGELCLLGTEHKKRVETDIGTVMHGYAQALAMHLEEDGFFSIRAEYESRIKRTFNNN